VEITGTKALPRQIYMKYIVKYVNHQDGGGFNKQLSMSKILKRPDWTTPDFPEYRIYGPDV
jgi:hypothetical protein